MIDEEKYIELYLNILKMFKDGEYTKPQLDTFDTFELNNNGYVVIPLEMSNDYMDPIYDECELHDVQGLTYGGYVVNSSHGLALLSLEQSSWRMIYSDMENKFITLEVPESIKSILNEIYPNVLPVVGFDNKHYRKNNVSTTRGCDILRNEVIKVYKKFQQVTNTN